MLSMRQEPQSDKSLLIFNDLSLPHEHIIMLHKKLLSPGQHTITTHDLRGAHTHFITLIESLGCYGYPAYFSLEQHAPTANVCDLYHYSKQHRQESHVAEFIQELEIDFLWIEETEALRKTVWYKDVKHDLNQSYLVRTMPIFTIESH